MFNDHAGKNIFDALLEARAVRKRDKSIELPEWTAYDKSNSCECCGSNFTWHSTFQGAAHEYRERHNCRNCGKLVCTPCSTHRVAIPKYGLIFPSRVCDKCKYSGEFA